MNISLFVIVYFITNILSIFQLNRIIFIGIAGIFSAILVSNNKVVFKTILGAIVLSTISYNLHEFNKKELELNRETIEFYGVAQSQEIRYDTYCEIIAKVTVLDNTFKTKIYFQNDGDIIQVSDKISGEAYFYIPTFKEDFDRERYYQSQGINVLASLDEINVIKNEKLTFNKFFYNVRENIKLNIDSLLNKDSSAFLKGIILGDKTDFDSEVSIDVSKSGISHILAISGMHITILCGFCINIFGKRDGNIISLIVISLFLFVVGASPSILRAIIMQYMMIFAWVINRQYTNKTSIWVALFLMLLFEPYIIFDIGFILSFASSLSLIYLYSPIYKALETKNKKINKLLIAPFCISISVMITTLIPTMYFFGYSSSVAILGNILIIPIITILFPLSFTFVLTGLINVELSKIFVVFIHFIVGLILDIISLISSFKYCIIPENNILTVIFILLLTISVTIFAFTKYKKCAVYGFAICIVGSFIYFSYEDFNSKNIHILSVGDGLCVIATFKDEVTVIDCGSSGYKNSGDKINEFMYKFGYEDIDTLIITSVDKTHTKDIYSLQYDVKNIIYPSKATLEESQNLLDDYILSNNIKNVNEVAEYIQIYQDVDKKIAVKIWDTLILHSFTNNMIDKLLENTSITAQTVILADKVIGDYRALEKSLNSINAKQAVLSNDYDMLSTVSGVNCMTTAQYSDIKIKNGGEIWQ